MLAQGDWWHIVPSAILTCLLPDIDHPKSFLGQRLKWISKPIARAFGIVVLPTVCWRYLRCWQPFTLRFLKSWFIPADALQHGAGLFEPHTCRYAGHPLVFPCSGHTLAFPLVLSLFPKGQPTGTFYLHGIICLVGMDAPFITPKTALFVGHRK